MPENVRAGFMLRQQCRSYALMGCNEGFFGFVFVQSSPYPIPGPISDALAANASPGHYAAITAESLNPVSDRYFEVTRDIPRMMDEYFRGHSHQLTRFPRPFPGVHSIFDGSEFAET